VCVAAFLFALFDSSHFKQCRTPRFFQRHAFAYAFLSFALNVVPKLRVQFPIDALAPKQRPHSQRQYVEQCCDRILWSR
jgi:hypothetical protein